MSADGQALIDGWLDGELSDAEERELMAWLETPENLRRFTEATAREQLLHEVVVEQELSEAAEENVVPMPEAESRMIWMKAAAVVALFGALIFLVARGGDGVNAEIVAVNEARLADQTEILETGAQLAPGRFQLESGSLEVALGSGVRVEFHAPVDAEFESDMRLRLFEGRMSADVGERGHGFTVVTDAGEVIDLGTEFGVEADRDGESRVAVFSGSVEVHSRDGSKKEKSITLTEGQAARFSVLAGLRRWDQVALAAQAAGLASVEYSGIVSRVRDNRGDDDLHPFYGIVRGGLQPGALAFTDKPNPRWAPRSGDAVPEWLQGADLIRTYHQFRMRDRYQLTLTLREPATVYVMIKPEQGLPGWLTENFVDTGERVAAGPFQQGIANWPAAETDGDGLPYFQFSIWKAEAPAGEFVLGSAKDPEMKNNKALMYGLAVQAKKVSQ